MAELDEFFNKAINIARDLGKSRTKRQQKQREVENLATFSRLNIADRTSRTGERRQLSDADLGQQAADLGRASLKVRKDLGSRQIDVQGRTAGVAERGATLKERSFERTGDLFNRFFPDPDADSGGNGPSAGFRSQSDQGVLSSARALVGSDRESALSNPKIQGVISGARRRKGIANSLEQDLLNLR
jgi:hypothetical protein